MVVQCLYDHVPDCAQSEAGIKAPCTVSDHDWWRDWRLVVVLREEEPGLVKAVKSLEKRLRDGFADGLAAVEKRLERVENDLRTVVHHSPTVIAALHSAVRV